MDTEKHRQSRCDDVRLTESGNTRIEQLLVMPYRVTNQQRMAATRALEWIRTSKAWLVLDMNIRLVQLGWIVIVQETSLKVVNIAYISGEYATPSTEYTERIYASAHLASPNPCLLSHRG